MEIIQKLSNHFSEDRLILKLMEEMAELNEVLIKTLTKEEKLKPSIDKIIEEAGDLKFRLEVVIDKLQIKDQVDQRFQEKSEQINEWFKNEFYV